MRNKLKYFIFVFAAALLLVNAKGVEAAGTQTNGDFQYFVGKDVNGASYAGITGYTGQEETLVIPETIDNIPVTTILGMENYQHPEKIKKMVISKNIKSLDCETFEDLSALESIEVAPENPLYYAKDGVLFSKYKKNTRLEFYPCAKPGDSYTVGEDVDEIQMAFLNNKYVKTLKIDAKLTHFNELADGSNIETIILPDTVKYITENAFRGCGKLTKVDLGDNVRSIMEDAFDGCTSLKTITIPDCVSKIDEDAFDNCPAKIKKASYLKKQKNGSYLAKAKIGKKEYTASTITKIAPEKKSYSIKKGKVTKLRTTAYVNKKKKGTLSTTSLLSFKSSNKKVLTISKYGNMKGIKKGTATVTVKLKTGDISYKVKVKVK